MRARRFWKKALRIKYLFAALIVLCLGIVAIVYFTVGLDYNEIEIPTMDFDNKDFTSFYGKTEDEVEKEKVVAENDKYKMFIDENTTIVTVVVKSSLKAGMDPEKVNSYAVKYASANSKGSTNLKKANFEVTYSSSNISNPSTDVLNSYAYSVNYINQLTGETEKRYAIKYLDDAVQVYYTVGNFANTSAYFPGKLYRTIYEPARVLYESDAEWQSAVNYYKNGYLAEVGNLSNTYEERFIGNVQTQLTNADNDDEKLSYVSLDHDGDGLTSITVFSQKAAEYLVETVFPEMGAEGFEVPEVVVDELEDSVKTTNLEDAKTTQEKKELLKKGLVEAKWTFNVPVELVTYGSEYYKKYFNNENSPLTNNPFLVASIYKSIVDSYKYQYDIEGINYPHYQMREQISPFIYDTLYTNEQTIKEKFKGGEFIEYPFVQELEDGSVVPYASSGFVALDEEGKFVYDENGNVKKQLYNFDIVDADNALFETESGGLPAFKIAMEFKLTEEGLKVSIPQKSIIDSSNVKESDPDYKTLNVPYYLTDVRICPNLTTVDSSQEGYMIVPDGSGAIINFNNGKTSTVSTTYYGKDLAYVDGVKTEDPARLLLGMFAFVNTTPENPGGLLTIIETGAGQITLTAGENVASSENFAYLSAQLRGKEKVKTGTVSDNKSFDKFDKKLAKNDVVINYMILDETETDYSVIAKKYQKYLIERDGLTFKDNTNDLVNDLTFLGTFEKYALFLGVKYMTSDTLTTFKQAEAIINELEQNGGKEFSVSYKSWTNEYLEYELGGSLKVAKVLGRTASMRSFYTYCVEKGIPFYPELSITTAKGYDYLFGSNKYTTRSVSNEEAVRYQYDLATLRQDKKLGATYMISPQYYVSAATKLMNDFNDLKIWNDNTKAGFYLTDLGNQWAGNYRKNQQAYGSEAVLYQQAALDVIADNGLIKIAAPCDYAFKYVDVAVEVPVSSSMYNIYDGTIPFYQLVISGLFDYSTEQINGSTSRSSQWYFAKALETGSNISYIISAEDPAILLETDYTQYYQAYYNNWKAKMIQFNNEINNLGIHGCTLTDHELVDGVSVVTYTKKDNSGKIVLVVNTTDTAKTYNGQTVPAYGYIKGN